MHARLDYWTLSQNCQNTLPWHAVAQLVSAQNETLLCLVGINYVKIGNDCKAKHLMAQNGETRIYVLEAELKRVASKTVKEGKYWVLTWLGAS